METKLKTAREPKEILADQLRAIESEAEDRQDALRLTFSVCESPLEQVFFLEYVNLYGAECAWMPDCVPCFSHSMPAHYGERAKDFEVFIYPQYEIKCSGKNYRADFMVAVKTFENSEWQAVEQIVVEIDGHDFHERTKQQAARDRSRDRALIAEGYKVLRFTGSEVYRNPLATLFELSEFISAACREVKA